MTATTPDAVGSSELTDRTQVTAPDDPTERERRFTAAVERLRTKVSGAQLHRWFRLAGPVLMPLGALMIVLAWWGTANTTRVFLQIPYLISGAVLGLGFMFVGGFVYFARWLTDLLDAVRTAAGRAEQAEERTAEALERIETLLSTWPSTAPPAAPSLSPSSPAAPAAPAPAEVPAPGEQLVTTPRGKLVHAATCRMVEGRSTRPLDRQDAADREACRICQPMWTG